jgi:hypothetical protein
MSEETEALIEAIQLDIQKHLKGNKLWKKFLKIDWFEF